MIAQIFNLILTHELCDSDAMLSQLRSTVNEEFINRRLTINYINNKNLKIGMWPSQMGFVANRVYKL